MALATGDVAPDFSLPTIGGTESGGETTLAGILGVGKAVLAFYPKDNTSG